MSANTALLVMDVQESIVARYPAAQGAWLERLATTIAAARARHMPVLYVIVSFRPGHPEISARNLMFSGIAQAGGLVNDKVHPAIAPRADEPVIVKKRVSAFAGSDLDVILRGKGVAHLVLTGIATSGVVLSTLRQAADLDYEITVLKDLCLDGDSEVHDVLVGKVFPRQARVMSSDAFIAG